MALKKFHAYSRLNDLSLLFFLFLFSPPPPSPPPAISFLLLSFILLRDRQSPVPPLFIALFNVRTVIKLQVALPFYCELRILLFARPTIIESLSLSFFSFFSFF